MSRRRQRGFTLIELLVVIAMIATLATIAMASYTSARQSARDTRRLSDMSQLSKALELYFNENTSSYPVACGTVFPIAVSSCTGSGATGIANELASVAMLNDPLPTNDLCTIDSTTSCNYAFSTIEPGTYSVYFFLEKSSNVTHSQCNRLTPDGISACK